MKRVGFINSFPTASNRPSSLQQVPQPLLANKKVLEKHFSKFGHVVKVVVNARDRFYKTPVSA
jgi:hypothetical protein